MIAYIDTRYTTQKIQFFLLFRVFVVDESGVRDNNKHKKQKQKKNCHFLESNQGFIGHNDVY